MDCRHTSQDCTLTTQEVESRTSIGLTTGSGMRSRDPPSTPTDDPEIEPHMMGSRPRWNKEHTVTDPTHANLEAKSVGYGVLKDRGPHQGACPQDSHLDSMIHPHLGGTV